MLVNVQQLEAMKPLERFLLPFKSFKSVFQKGSIYTKIILVLQCILFASGPMLFGQIEVGLILFLVFYGLCFGAGYIIHQVSINALKISTFTQVTVLVILFAAILLVLYSTFKSTVELADKRNDGEYVVQSVIYDFFKKIILNISHWFKEFHVQFQVGDKKCKTLLILSYFTFGIPLIVFGETVKGIALFLVQALGISYLIARGVVDIQIFLKLHVSKYSKLTYNSVLVYGVIAFVVVALLLFMYFVSLNQTLKAADDYNKKRLGTNFKKQLYSLIDKNFYITSLIVPVVGALVFTVIPLIFMIVIAFTNYSLKPTAETGYPTSADVNFLNWAGIDTFRRLLSYNANFADLLSVFAWTIIWALLATFTCYFGGLLLALLVNKKSIKLKPMWRSIFVISMAMPQFVSLLVMRTLFAEYGPLEQIFANLGWLDKVATTGMVSETLKLWDNEFIARALIIFINMWVGIPYYMLLMSGLLINIPKDYYEAARIAGASRYQQFKRITFPNIIFMTTPMLITSFVNNINNFNVIWFLTQGGPADTAAVNGTAGKTDILITWLYQITQKGQLDYNFGAAIGIIMFAITATLSLIVFRRSSAYKNEEAYR